MLREKTAKRIAVNWHGGQWSAYYQFNSTGYIIANHLRYLQETETNLHPEYDLHPGELTKKDERELIAFKEYILNEGKKHGIETEFVKHSVYGYLIPYIAEHVPDELCNKITPVAYLK